MPYSINEAEILIDNLLSYYNVSTYSDLGIKISVSQQNISKWKARNSISAIKKKCRELKIYNDIFVISKHNIEKENENIDNIVINDILLEQAKEKASQYGLNINSYLEFLIVQDLK